MKRANFINRTGILKILLIKSTTFDDPYYKVSTQSQYQANFTHTHVKYKHVKQYKYTSNLNFKPLKIKFTF